MIEFTQENSWRLHGIGRKANSDGGYVETQKQIGVWVPIWSFGCQWGLGQSPSLRTPLDAANPVEKSGGFHDQSGTKSR